MVRVFIVHFQPVERYPPVTNLINYLAERYPDARFEVITTGLPVGSSAAFLTKYANVRVRRTGVLPEGRGTLSRVSFYAAFNLKSAFWVLSGKPDAILYYETLSAFSAWVSRQVFGRKVDLLAHYHEYTSLVEYQQGMKLVRGLHGLERRIYDKMKWISQTNELRLDRFREDEGLKDSAVCRVMPNYPPLSWKRPVKAGISIPLKIVYVGALSSETMFLKEFAEWVASKDGVLLWDIYSGNLDESARAFLSALQCSHISYKGAVAYEDLPGVLERYDVGVILYKGHIPNYVINAPNKLFEYLACGLDVWFPHVMKGSLKYVRTDRLPRVLAVDFQNLREIDINDVCQREGVTLSDDVFFAENVYGEIGSALFREGES